MKENTSSISIKENIRDRKTTKEKMNKKKVMCIKGKAVLNKRSRYRSHKEKFLTQAVEKN